MRGFAPVRAGARARLRSARRAPARPRSPELVSGRAGTPGAATVIAPRTAWPAATASASARAASAAPSRTRARTAPAGADDRERQPRPRERRDGAGDGSGSHPATGQERARGERRNAPALGGGRLAPVATGEPDGIRRARGEAAERQPRHGAQQVPRGDQAGDRCEEGKRRRAHDAAATRAATPSPTGARQHGRPSRQA
jgi:hypothetical protein